MKRWGVRERVCAVELFIRTGSITETQRGFRLERNQQEAPSPNAIRLWVRQILTNFINAPLMIRKLQYGALFGPEESLDPTSWRMKTEKPSQSHRNVTQRWSMNFCLRIFHQTMAPCGFNKMVLRPTRQWLASQRFALCFGSSGWFLVSVMFHGLLVRRT